MNPYESPQGTDPPWFDPGKIVVTILKGSVAFVLMMLFFPAYTYYRWPKWSNYSRASALITCFLWIIDVFLVVSLLVGYNWILRLVEYFNAVVN